MEYEPQKIPFTRVLLEEGASPEARAAWLADQEEAGLVIRCSDEARLGQLAIKLEEYTRRAQISAQKLVVRDAICKMAILGHLLRSDESMVDYMDAFDYAIEGMEAYGADVLIESPEEAEGFLQEFDSAFDTVRSYVLSGNQFVTGGTQLPEA